MDQLRRLGGGLSAVAGLCALAAGCSGGAVSAGDGAALSAADGQFVDCSHETRATPYAPGTLVKSKNGVFDVTLVDNRPGLAAAQNPPGDWVKGSNTWDLEVTDAAGDDLAGLSIVTSPQMPDHGHGTSITPVTTDEGSGRYVISPLYLYMGGYWEITLKIRPPAADAGVDAGLVPDSALFKVCIPD
ncbi:MAG TPA: FixH family protein [Polyangia bacterium]|nr:FixH family protein [Polyangia bacterium]